MHDNTEEADVDRSADSESPTVIVGFDGRWQTRGRLLDRAALEAERRGLPLVLVTVLRRHSDPDGQVRGVHPDDQHSVRTAWISLSNAVESLRSAYPMVPMRAMCLEEDDVLSGQPPLRSAELLILGFEGQFHQTAFHERSVSAMLLAAVQCPVLLLPDTLEGSPQIRRKASEFVLLGVGGEDDGTLVRTALDEAARRGCDVHLLHSDPSISQDPQARHLNPLWDLIRSTLAAAMHAKPPLVSVTLTTEHPAVALLRYSTDAAVLVVGARPGALTGQLGESISRHLLTSARCPLLAVPRPALLLLGGNRS